MHDSGIITAIDGSGAETDRRVVPSGSRVEAEAVSGLLISEDSAELALLDDEGRRRAMGLAAWTHAVSATRWAWTTQFAPSVLRVGHVDRPDVLVEAPEVTEWHQCGSFSPDGSRLAIGGYLLPLRVTDDVSVTAGPLALRRSVMAVIDTNTGEAVVAGTYGEFAWIPAWRADGEWLVFAAPFQPRRLYGMRPDDPTLHEWRFTHEPPAPMLDVTGVQRLGSSLG
jgi:hypothetical protein